MMWILNVVCIALLTVLLLTKPFKIRFSKNILNFVYYIFSLNLIIKLANYPINESTDAYTYQTFLTTISRMKLSEVWYFDNFELFFRYYSWVMVQFFDNNTFVVLVFITNIIIIMALYNIFEDKMLSIISIFIYTNAPLFFTMSTNIIRQAMAIALILLLLSLKDKYSKVISIILPFIHLSSVVFTMYFLFNKYIKVKWLLWLTIISALLFITHLNSTLFLSFGYESTYTNMTNFGVENFKNMQGNRLDFFVLTTLVTLLASYLYRKKQVNSYIYKYILISSILFYCLGFQGFSDRLAIYNWWTLLITTPLLIKYLIGRIHSI